MTSFRTNSSWNNDNNLRRPSVPFSHQDDYKSSSRSNRSWDNGTNLISPLIRPYNSTTTSIGPFLHQDEYKASSYPEFRSPRALIEAAIRSSIDLHGLNETSLISLYVTDSDGNYYQFKNR